MMPPGQPIQPEATPFDTGNICLVPGPSQLDLTTATNAATGEQALIFTLRGTSGSQTAWLTRDEAIAWMGRLEAKITQMSGLVRPAPLNLPPGGLNGGHP